MHNPHSVSQQEYSESRFYQRSIHFAPFPLVPAPCAEQSCATYTPLFIKLARFSGSSYWHLSCSLFCYYRERAFPDCEGLLWGDAGYCAGPQWSCQPLVSHRVPLHQVCRANSGCHAAKEEALPPGMLGWPQWWRDFESLSREWEEGERVNPFLVSF